MTLDEDALRILEMPELLGTQLVVSERVGQILREGWSPEHDDAHPRGNLMSAGRCYLLLAQYQMDGRVEVTELMGSPPPLWPWGHDWWKPSESVSRNIEKGAALVCAELDRELSVK